MWGLSAFLHLRTYHLFKRPSAPRCSPVVAFVDEHLQQIASHLPAVPYDRDSRALFHLTRMVVAIVPIYKLTSTA